MDALGFIQFWGVTPAINVFKGVDNIDVNKSNEEINILFSECGGDGRDLFKTIGDLAIEVDDPRDQPINIYIHEKKKENLARVILFLTLFCETGMSIRERMEIFLDIYGNSLLRDRSSQYLESIVPELIRFVTDDESCESPLKGLINFDTIKFKDRDEIEDIVSSWLTAHPFDIESLRDTRLRHHFGKRYDFRRNLVDWDYNFGIKDFAKHVNQLEYRQFRLTGVAFETRLANGTIPNRTLGSFVEGRKRKGTRDSIMVRGFWGDIINSPYMPFGNEVDDPDDYKRFYKQVNFQNIYSNADVSEYNVQKFIFQMEELDEFEYRFERLRHILQDKYEDPSGKMPRPKKKRAKKVIPEDSKEEEEADKTTMASEKDTTKSSQPATENEEEETMIEEITDEQAEQIEKEAAEREAAEREAKEKAEEEAKKKLEAKKKKAEEDEAGQITETDNNNPMKGVEAAKKTINLGEIPEGMTEVKEENVGTRKILQAFEFLNVKIHLLSDDLNKLYTKQKYQNYFDIGVLSIGSGDRMKEDGIQNIWKPGAKVHIETCDNLVIMKKDQRQEYRDKVKEYAGTAGWKQQESPYGHHMFYDVNKK